MHVLVLTSEPVGAGQLRHALGDALDPSSTEVLVVAPALHESQLRFWLSDADEAIARADEVQAETVKQLDAAGLAVGSERGDSEPLRAIEDALRAFDADRIVAFTHAESEQRYREDLDAEEAEHRFGVRVEIVEVAGS